MNPYDKLFINQFIQFLERQRDAKGRAVLAELRRAAADPLKDNRSIWIFGLIIPDSDGWAFDAYQLVATLYAIHAQRFTTPDGGYKLPRFGDDTDGEEPSESVYIRKSFGESLRRLRVQLGGNGEDSLDKRVVALLDTDQSDLAVPMRAFIQRIATAKMAIPVDYRQLLKDLLHWNGDKTRRQWARDYWQPRITEGDEIDPITISGAPAPINN